MPIGGVYGFITMELAPDGRPASTNWGQAFDSALNALPPEQFPECVRAMPQMKTRAFVRAGPLAPRFPFTAALTR
ncbi:hypothetical protein [Salipiger sp. 1_MG-2023]|uniref:hypothetical protein n=1 Tax=Salipiger sp. 1_MG-2023 TaxID=3062665 RepID=UPI0026E22952|nr:hypothetical protein [Salipiger sp. 1_MG-2023]